MIHCQKRKLEQFWTNKFEASTSILNMSSSRENRDTCKLLQENIQCFKECYQLPLPWQRQAAVKLRNNRVMALRRLVSLKNRFLRNSMLKVVILGKKQHQHLPSAVLLLRWYRSCTKGKTGDFTVPRANIGVSKST